MLEGAVGDGLDLFRARLSAWRRQCFFSSTGPGSSQGSRSISRQRGRFPPSSPPDRRGRQFLQVGSRPRRSPPRAIRSRSRQLARTRLEPRQRSRRTRTGPAAARSGQGDASTPPTSLAPASPASSPDTTITITISRERRIPPYWAAACEPAATRTRYPSVVRRSTQLPHSASPTPMMKPRGISTPDTPRFGHQPA